MERYIAALDQGTTSTRFIIFNQRGEIVAQDQKEHQQIYPSAGLVEHNALEIWQRTQEVITGALRKSNLQAAQISAIGITNQRETTLVWDKVTGKPYANAIVWQDTRTDSLCAELAREGGQDRFRPVTGLPLATYFSGPKLRWMLDHIPGLRADAEAGRALFGTIDSWLIWNLTGQHCTDVTNASRTLLMNLARLDWDTDILTSLDIPRSILPRIRSSAEIYGYAQIDKVSIPIAGVLGDQQAALFGQACFTPGEAKNTYGTGCFLLLNTGSKPMPSRNGLLTTLGYQIGTAPPVYALEGSIAITGALVQWLRDNLGLIQTSAEIEPLARSVNDNGGIYFVPAFSGLFAPYWRSDARGALVGLTRYINKGHIARAVLEASAFQTREVVEAMENDSGVALSMLKVDGGMVGNDLLMQFQADLLDAPVIRPSITETTALGAAFAAGLVVGFWENFDALRLIWREDRRWKPTMSSAERSRLYKGWKKAVTRTFDWVEA
jgi:glycerol kinase